MKKQNSKHSEKDAENFYEMLTKIKTADEAERLISDLCTPAERDAMIDRWTVANLLDEGIPYRTIQEKTGVSVTTVTRVARCLNGDIRGYRDLIEKIS